MYESTAVPSVLALSGGMGSGSGKEVLLGRDVVPCEGQVLSHIKCLESRFAKVNSHTNPSFYSVYK